MRQGTQALMDAYNTNPYQSAIINVTLKSGTQLTLTNNDILEDGMVIDRYSTYNETVTMGTCVASELRLKLNNRDGRFDSYDFAGATMEVFVDIETTRHMRLECGYYIVDGQPRNRSEIDIEALDVMSLLDRPMTTDMFKDPYGTQQIDQIPIYNAIYNILYYCTGTPVSFFGKLNANLYVNTKKLPPFDGVLTCRQYIAWLMAVMGAFGTLDPKSHFLIDVGWYEMHDYDDPDQLVYICDPANRYSFDYALTPITISGLFYKSQDQTSVLIGLPDYAIDFSNNPIFEDLYFLNTDTQTQHIERQPVSNTLTNIYDERKLTYTPFNATVRPAPYLWPGDPVDLHHDLVIGYDEYDNPIWGVEIIPTILTHVTYKLNGATYIAAEGQTAEAHGTVPTTGSSTINGANVVANNLMVLNNISVPSGALLKVVSVNLMNATEITGGEVKTGTTAVEAGDGWTPVCVASWTSNSRYANIYYMQLVDGSVSWRVSNTSTSDHNYTVNAYVLCVHTGNSGTVTPDDPGGGGSAVSPTVEVVTIPGGHQVIITDVNGTHSFNVMDGTYEDIGLSIVNGLLCVTYEGG